MNLFSVKCTKRIPHQLHIPLPRARSKQITYLFSFSSQSNEGPHQWCSGNPIVKPNIWSNSLGQFFLSSLSPALAGQKDWHAKYHNSLFLLASSRPVREGVQEGRFQGCAISAQAGAQTNRGSIPLNISIVNSTVQDCLTN
jgi:hypothetical protein